MEKLALLETVSKSTIQDAVNKGEWLDGTILTRHMIHKLKIHASQMDDSVRFEKIIYLKFNSILKRNLKKIFSAMEIDDADGQTPNESAASESDAPESDAQMDDSLRFDKIQIFLDFI